MSGNALEANRDQQTISIIGFFRCGFQTQISFVEKHGHDPGGIWGQNISVVICSIKCWEGIFCVPRIPLFPVNPLVLHRPVCPPPPDLSFPFYSSSSGSRCHLSPSKIVQSNWALHLKLVMTEPQSISSFLATADEEEEPVSINKQFFS